MSVARGQRVLSELDLLSLTSARERDAAQARPEENRQCRSTEKTARGVVHQSGTV